MDVKIGDGPLRRKVYEEITQRKELNEALQTLAKLHQSIRSRAPANLNFQTLSSEVNYLEWMNGKPTRRAVLFLPILYGCSWKQKCGGCFNCGMAQGLNIVLPSVLAIKPIVDKVVSWVTNQQESPEWVCIYNEGSYLNPKELPLKAQQIILEVISDINSVKRVTIESRPEYINEQALKWLQDMALSFKVEIEIGIGVEVENDFIRRYCINKGFSWQVFEDRVNAMAKHGIRSLAYVLLKPLFLSEREAIEECIRTINRCFRSQVNAVSLETMSIQEWTILEYLWLKGLYRLPKLWSVIDVISRVAELGEVRIGGEPATYFPNSLRAAHNCAKCTERIWRKIRQYNETHNLQNLLESSCECKEEWHHEINDGEEGAMLENKVAKRIIAASQLSLSLEDYLRCKILSGR